MSHEPRAQSFVDVVCITAQSGNGGAGLVSFRREKYIPKGGPDGGDGGNGGSVIVKASPHERTLRRLRYQSLYPAKNGHAGMAQKKHGKNGEDAVLSVPIGTVVRDAVDKRIVAKLFAADDSVVLLRGGMGGRGNVHFKSSVRQTPMYAQKGKAGLVRDFILELELSADASFIGMPNVGKSTLLKVLTNANPRIGNYPFTTLIPNMGTLVMRHGELVLSDIPGIVEGAADGRGLGLHFLKHIKRSSIIVYVLDGSDSAQIDMALQYATVWRELVKYGEVLSATSEVIALAEKPQCVVISKMDSNSYFDMPEKCVETFMAGLSKLRTQNSEAFAAISSIDEKCVVCVSAHMARGLDLLKELLFAKTEAVSS